MTELQIFDCEQGTPEWHECRLGIPTASMFQTVLAKGKGGGESLTRKKYMLKLIGERLTGQMEEGYKNAHMERGNAMEDEARELYSMLYEIEPKRVGFMRRGLAGASPDSLLGDDGLLEIKTKIPSIHLDVLLSGKVPAEHKAQIQGQLWISGRQYCDFVSYWPALPPFIVRVQRDDDYISKLADEVGGFILEMETITNDILRKTI